MDNVTHIHFHFEGGVPPTFKFLEEPAQAPNQAPTLTPVDAAASTSAEVTKYANVYNSSRQAFALGSKLWDSADAARRHATEATHCGTVAITTVNGDVKATGLGCGTSRYWALLDANTLGKNSYTDLEDLMGEYPDARAYLWVSRDASGCMSVKGV